MMMNFVPWEPPAYTKRGNKRQRKKAIKKLLTKLDNEAWYIDPYLDALFKKRD